ncbi:MAG TPA: BamA/TamA family outer membrane protein [Bacteroidales bacterium]|nr:BamA/TamA family outer membrane protein [Bacteroidales bacterium]HRZ75749.1 BamA/TamA family outer membrane protein [Bacteroidales bacterium]
MLPRPRHHAFLLILLGSLLGLGGCSAARYLEEDQYFVDRNRMAIEKDMANVSGEDLLSLARQKPNPRILRTWRFSSWAHYYSQARDTRFRRWIGNTMAKEPVLLDTSLSESSLRQMDLYLQNKGAFGNRLGFSVRKSRHGATVTYHVMPGREYTLERIITTVEDSIARLFLSGHFGESLLRQGMVYDVDILDNERDRIVRLLKEYGFYAFTREYIRYQIDSTGGKGGMKLQMILSNPPGKDHHPRYAIRRIFIHTDFDPLLPLEGSYDTLIVADKRNSMDKPLALYHIIYRDRLKVDPDVLIQNIYIDPGLLFSAGDAQRSYRRLSELRLFRQVNIQFRDVSHVEERLGNALDVEIRLVRAPVNAFSVETEGTNSAGDLGIAGNLVFENRNLFRNAETFNIRLKGAMELQRMAEGSGDEFLIFNTFETGAQAGLRFPRFLLPVSPEQFPKLFEPLTLLDLGFNVRQRPDYRRTVTNLSFGYEWKEGNTRKHVLYPADFNAVNIVADSTFDPGRFGPRYVAQYSDHLLAALKYSFILNTQPIARGGDYRYFRANFSASGNFLNFASSLMQAPHDAEGHYRLFNIRFAQFIRLDADFRNYLIFREGHVLATRMASGLGVPYGNSDVLPFEQAFFSGGANGLRGWELRSLGPGGFRDLSGSTYDKIGDILLEANAEYRFPVYSYLKGAIYADIGNVWLLHAAEAFPHGEFSSGRFLSELAVDAGLGFRLDFSFFLFRLDLALPLRDPSFSEGERWHRLKDWQGSDLVWNFGIGYPF